MENLPAWMEKHPLTQKIKADHEEARIKGREEIVREIEGLQAERRAIPCTDDAVEGIREAIRRKEKEIQDLKAEAGKRTAESYRRRLEIETKVDRLQGKLLESVDPKLVEEIEYFQGIYDKLRDPRKIKTQKYKGGRNLFTETEQIITATNAEAIAEGLKYCMAAMEEIGKMKFQAEPDTERLQALRQNIPNHEELKEIIGTRALQGLKTPDPFSRFRSDSEIEWSKNRLFEKGKKLMKR